MYSIRVPFFDMLLPLTWPQFIFKLKQMEIKGSGHHKLIDKKSIQVIATSALICIYLFIILIISLHFLPTGYDPLRSPTSEYAVGNYGYLMSTAFVFMSVGCFALLVGLYKAISRSSRSKAGLILLGIWAIGVLIAFIFPIAPEGTPSNTADKIHRANGPITFLCVTLGTIFISVSVRRDENWRSIYQSALTLSIIMLLIFVSVVINFSAGLRLEGILQRIYLIIFSTWFIIIALRLRKIYAVAGMQS